MLIVVVSVVGNFTEEQNFSTQKMKMANTDIAVTYDFNANAYFYSNNDKGFFFCTKDGVQYLSPKAEQVWASTYSLANPVFSTKSGFIAVGEPKGTNVYVFDKNGKYTDIRTDGPVLSFSVNQTGYLSVISQDGDGYKIGVYSQKGGPDPIWLRNHTDMNVLPISCDVSSDGRIVAVSYLDLNTRISSNIVFSYISNEKLDFPDTVFGAVLEDNRIVGMVKFMENNKLLTISDASVNCYQPRENHSIATLWSIPVGNEIMHFTLNGEKGFAMSLGEKLLNNPNAVEPGVLQFYGLGGEKTGEYRFTGRSSYLYMDYNTAILGEGNKFLAVNTLGGVLWEHNATADVKQLIFVGDKNTVLSVSEMSAEMLKYSRVTVTSDTPPTDAPKEDKPTADSVETEAPTDTEPTDTPEPAEATE